MDPLFIQLEREFERRFAKKDAKAAARYEVVQRTRMAFTPVAREFPPTDLQRVARSLGVKDIRYTSLSIDGKLIREFGRFVIEVNQGHSEARQRFTVAHELGHLIVSQRGALGCSTIGTRSGRQDKPDLLEEELCNCSAAELLIPIEWARSFLTDRPPSFSTITGMAKVCKTSIEVAARRSVEAGVWRCRLVWWKLRNDRLVAFRGFPSYDAMMLSGMEVPDWPQSLFGKVLRDGKPRAGTQPIYLEGEIQEYNVEVWRADRSSIASMMIFDRIRKDPHRMPTLFDNQP